MTGALVRANVPVRCTCGVSQVCRDRGCHVLTGPTRLGYDPWVRGVTVCADCPVGAEDMEEEAC